MAIYNSSALRGYNDRAELIPLHPWNKQINGVARGKTPIDLEWTTKKYNQNDRKKWITA